MQKLIHDNKTMINFPQTLVIKLHKQFFKHIFNKNLKKHKHLHPHQSQTTNNKISIHIIIKKPQKKSGPKVHSEFSAKKIPKKN